VNICSNAGLNGNGNDQEFLLLPIEGMRMMSYKSMPRGPAQWSIKTQHTRKTIFGCPWQTLFYGYLFLSLFSIQVIINSLPASWIAFFEIDHNAGYILLDLPYGV
jgi:hypothetical protein